ncbi:hypothetical protein B9Z19DRAFT_1190267 [Tuber borchii]|uniref:Uncharacterized protein n=1 Tax=Tuber borchii TaxID=42251 RepID=A0A2T7A4F5_TUBBO|nr:hypothetical protein B9Z19DRAFT_1190267 [Tuber borchii]
MQAKVFLSYLLATILAVGVVATPVDVFDSGTTTTPTPDVNNVFDIKFQALAISTGTPAPTPTGPVITPGDDDVVPAPTGSVFARDLPSLEKRTPGCIKVTSDSKFNGISAHPCLPSWKNYVCTDLTPYWRYNISSIRPDPGTNCIIYTVPNCSGFWWGPFTWPGYGHLGSFNDNMGSVKCWW